jgi:hypothetical protein
VTFVESVRGLFRSGRTPKLNDVVSHEGAFGKKGGEDGAYRIVDFIERAVIQDSAAKVVVFCKFQNRRFTVTCLLDDLVWLEEDRAWMIPGRLLNAAQKKQWMEILGAKFPPPADKHVTARAFLRAQGAID